MLLLLACTHHPSTATMAERLAAAERHCAQVREDADAIRARVAGLWPG